VTTPRRDYRLSPPAPVLPRWRQTYPAAHVRPIADELVELLRPMCDRIEIAGSLRRGRPEVGDIEIVAIARSVIDRDLFGERFDRDGLDVLCNVLAGEGKLRPRLDSRGRGAWGPKYKRLWFREIPVDLFVVSSPAQYGVILAIRTGPAEYSKKLVTPSHFLSGGMMPPGMRCHDGALWRRHGALEDLIVTPDEADVYRAIGADYVAPEDRR
jgi:DNA polymerase/3'-5' exonuclease PolX